jgi:hypothetical protein
MPNEMGLVKPACEPPHLGGELGKSAAQVRRHEVRDARVGAVVGAPVGARVGAAAIYKKAIEGTAGVDVNTKQQYLPHILYPVIPRC